ncbi:MAG: hypothetical protein AseanaTS_23640 [Candidatus Pelagadaptatus aseana]|uniref:AraC family transcriptional regulator n=1 Tax=Candidatus Pelagadaptatus aseana TaxID=3120508 RepID=UPI0039B2486A
MQPDQLVASQRQHAIGHQLRTIEIKQLQRLEQVLVEEFSYIDRQALGHYCGLDKAWWLPESGYGFEEYLRLLKQLQVNEVPNIALRLARRFRIDDAGITGYAMLSSATLEQGLELSTKMSRQVFRYLSFGMRTQDDLVLIECHVDPLGLEFSRALQELWVVYMWKNIQALLPDGVAACPSYAVLNFDAPTYQWQYQQILGCRVEFNKERTLLAIPRQWLFIGVKGNKLEAQGVYDSQSRRLLKDHINHQDIVSRLKRVLIEHPVESGFSLEKTAPLMSLSSRTLRRYLSDAGSTFRQVVLQVRMELAKDYLLNTGLSIQEIAYQLGYAQPNNFHRAFKAFYGLPPEGFRLSHDVNATLKVQ